MRVAQRLYENGYITYMRTDSTTLSEAALTAARSQARELYGAASVPDKPRTRALVLGGVGATVTPPRTGGRAPEAIAAALLADDPVSIESVAGKAFRAFADYTGSDRRALAALSRSDALRYSVRFDAITVPTLVVAGADDTLIKSPGELAGRLPSARSVTVTGDHLGAPYDPAFARAIVDFLDQAQRNH